MGRGRGKPVAATVVPPVQRTSFSPRWDELSVVLRRRQAESGASRRRDAHSGDDLQLVALLERLRNGNAPNVDTPRDTRLLSEALIAVLRAEHPDLRDIRQLLPMRFVDSADELELWMEVSKRLRAAIPSIAKLLSGVNDPQIDATSLKDNARRIFIKQCLAGVPQQLSAHLAVRGMGTPRHLADQLPNLDMPDWNFDLPGVEIPDLKTDCARLGYLGVGDAFGTLTKTQWGDIYAEFTADVEWMRPDAGEDMTFVDRYKVRFARLLAAKLTDGTVQPIFTFPPA